MGNDENGTRLDPAPKSPPRMESSGPITEAKERSKTKERLWGKWSATLSAVGHKIYVYRRFLYTADVVPFRMICLHENGSEDLLIRP